ncbi:MAG: CoB--CoM heterodisulfide reductase iron-sulfur subunit B family protein [Desulfovibrionaceae bacterium]
MNNTFAFFPGCVLEAASKEAKTATFAVAKKLGIELIEIDGWSCCGATHVQDIDQETALTVNARNLALAEKMGLPLITACSTCSMVLSGARKDLDNEKRRTEINGNLRDADIQYNGTTTVTHILWELVKRKDDIKNAMVKTLSSLNIAPFYGCHTLRSEGVDKHQQYRPTALEELISLLGATPIDYRERLKCCGFHAVFPAEIQVKKMNNITADAAIASGADFIVTPCPLCQMQLDMNQPTYLTSSEGKIMPILYLTQMIGLALDCTEKELGLSRHVVSAKDFLTKIA